MNRASLIETHLPRREVEYEAPRTKTKVLCGKGIVIRVDLVRIIDRGRK